MQNTQLYKNVTESVNFQIQRELSRYISIKKSIKKRLDAVFVSNHRRNQLFTTLGLINSEIRRRMSHIETPKESDIQIQIREAKQRLQRDHHKMSANQIVSQKDWISILENKAS